MESLKKRGKGIVLLHDFQTATAEAAMDLLNDLKAGGYKIVFMQPKDQVQTLARYDALIAERSGTPPSASNTLPSFTVPPMAAAPPQVSVPQTFPAPQPSIGRRVALVIGNSSYRPPPSWPIRNDAADMAAALRKRGFRVIVGLDLDKAAMDSKLREFESELRGAEAGVFFYAGHALQMTGKDY